MFLALLELLKRHIVKISQEHTFDDIDIFYNEEVTKNEIENATLQVDEYK